MQLRSGPCLGRVRPQSCQEGGHRKEVLGDLACLNIGQNVLTLAKVGDDLDTYSWRISVNFREKKKEYSHRPPYTSPVNNVCDLNKVEYLLTKKKSQNLLGGWGEEVCPFVGVRKPISRLGCEKSVIPSKMEIPERHVIIFPRNGDMLRRERWLGWKQSEGRTGAADSEADSPS